MNNRVAIKAAIKALLLNNTDADANVFTNRKSNLWNTELPAIIISTTQEPTSRESLSSKRYVRDLELRIEAKVEASDSVDDDMDTLAGQIEDVLANNQTFSGTVLASQQQNTEIIIDETGEKPVGVATLTFTAKYIA